MSAYGRWPSKISSVLLGTGKVVTTHVRVLNSVHLIHKHGLSRFGYPRVAVHHCTNMLSRYGDNLLRGH